MRLPSPPLPAQPSAAAPGRLLAYCCSRCRTSSSALPGDAARWSRGGKAGPRAGGVVVLTAARSRSVLRTAVARSRGSPSGWLRSALRSRAACRARSALGSRLGTRLRCGVECPAVDATAVGEGGSSCEDSPQQPQGNGLRQLRTCQHTGVARGPCAPAPPHVSWAWSGAASLAAREAGRRRATAGAPTAACRPAGRLPPAPAPASAARTQWGRTGRWRWGGRRGGSQGGRHRLSATAAALLCGGGRGGRKAWILQLLLAALSSTAADFEGCGPVRNFFKCSTQRASSPGSGARRMGAGEMSLLGNLPPAGDRPRACPPMPPLLPLPPPAPGSRPAEPGGRLMLALHDTGKLGLRV